jgi:hypothetical protein
MTIRIENAAADARALRDEELNAVSGGESKPKGAPSEPSPRPRPSVA